jgi:acetamidase/formamidase
MLRLSAPMLLFIGLVLATCAAGQQAKMAPHVLRPGPKTVEWGYFDGSKPPILTINSGEVVDIESPLAGSKEMEIFGLADRITPAMRELEAGVPDSDKGPGANILVGPIEIKGAEPGDVLEVRILSLRVTTPYAVNLFRQGDGALAEDFPRTQARAVPLDLTGNVAKFAGAKIPLKPFFGTMGVAPPRLFGRISDSSPDYYAGNLDNKEMVVGTTLYIPVQVAGAMFSVGDGHAGQGDGEVDGTAIEVGLRGNLQLSVRKDLHLLWPRAETPEYFITMGFDRDLNRAAVQAVREMVDYLVNERNIDRTDAYMLTSMAADLHVTQIVDGTKGVHAMLPKQIFPTRSAGAVKR